MYRVDGTTITLTRGDSAVIEIELKQDDDVYTPSGGDVVRFAMKHPDMSPMRKKFVERKPILYKVIPNESMLLTFIPEDTKKLDFGEYVYDMEITFENGKVDTFITEAKLILTPEVD